MPTADVMKQLAKQHFGLIATDFGRWEGTGKKENMVGSNYSKRFAPNTPMAHAAFSYRAELTSAGARYATDSPVDLYAMAIKILATPKGEATRQTR